MSKTNRSGLGRRSDRNLKSPETSIATRVRSPNDQKRTAVTLLLPARVARDAAKPALAPNSALSSVAAAILLRRPDMQPAILVNERIQLRMLFFFLLNNPGRGHRLRRRLFIRRRYPRFSVPLAHLVHVIPRLR